MASNTDTVKVKDRKNGVTKNFRRDVYEKSMSASKFAGQQRFTIVSESEAQAPAAKAKSAPIEKKKPVVASAEEGSNDERESAADKFLREHKAREAAKAGNSSENQNQQ